MATPLGVFRFANYIKQEGVFVKRAWSAAVLPVGRQRRPKPASPTARFQTCSTRSKMAALPRTRSLITADPWARLPDHS